MKENAKIMAVLAGEDIIRCDACGWSGHLKELLPTDMTPITLPMCPKCEQNSWLFTENKNQLEITEEWRDWQLSN